MSSDKKRYGSTLYKLSALRHDILPRYNNHIHRILSKMNEVAKYADSADTLGMETVEEIADGVRSLLDIHKNYNRGNVHNETASTVGLGLVQDLKIASILDMEVGTAGNLYLTPKLAEIAVNNLVIKKVDEHVHDYELPHQETAHQIGSLTRAEIDAINNSKYFKTEVVENAELAVYNGLQPYNNIRTTFRKDLPPGNFGHGFVHPARVAGGAYSPSTIVTSDNRRWVDIKDLVKDVDYTGRMITSATFSSAYNLGTAISFLNTTQPYTNIPVGSICFFNIYNYIGSMSWGGNGGGYNLYSWTRHAAVKYGPNSWEGL